MSNFKLRQTDLHWREIDEEVIALEARSSMYVAANSAGTVLWRALVAGSSRDELADALVDAYGIDREQALGDVDAFVAQLADHDLLAR